MRPLAPLVVLALASPLCALETRTLRLEVDAGSAFAVENLAGRMDVKPGSGDKAVAVATVHAETAELLKAMRFEEVRGKGGLPTLRVRYPLENNPTIRYAGAGAGAEKGEGKSGHHSGFFSRLFSGGTTTEYDGQRVRISSSDGVELWADVVVELPRHDVTASFRNSVGNLVGESVEGRLRFETGSGDVTLKALKGEVKAETGSGDIAAANLGGTFEGETGSGTCTVDGLHGDRVSCETGSGEVRVHGVQAKRIEASTGSGDVKAESIEGDDVEASTGSGDVALQGVTARRLKLSTGSGEVEARGVDVRDVTADTGSGDVLVEARSGKVERVAVDTGSGDVRLQLGSAASFEAHAEQSSGDLTSRFADAQPIIDGKTVVGYRRGEGRTRISVSTGSGDLTLEE